MKQPHELLHDLRHTKRASCMSEYEGWINDIVEYLEAQVKTEPVDPTIKSQLPLPFEFPSLWDGLFDTRVDLRESNAQTY